MQYILPLIVVIIYLKGYYDMFSGKSTAVFVSWMCFCGAAAFRHLRRFDFYGTEEDGKTKK